MRGHASHTRLRPIALGALVAALALGAPSPAAALPELLVDPTDGAFDASRWLASRNGFVPLVVPITEPALGYGAAGGLVFFHARDEGQPQA